MNQNICLSNDLWVCEGDVCCIGDLYSLINLEKQFGDGFGRIIWSDHGTGGILNFSRSDGYIWIVLVIEEFECCGLWKTEICIGYFFSIVIMQVWKDLLLEGIITWFCDVKLNPVYHVLAHKLACSWSYGSIWDHWKVSWEIWDIEIWSIKNKVHGWANK